MAFGTWPTITSSRKTYCQSEGEGPCKLLAIVEKPYHHRSHISQNACMCMAVPSWILPAAWDIQANHCQVLTKSWNSTTKGYYC